MAGDSANLARLSQPLPTASTFLFPFSFFCLRRQLIAQPHEVCIENTEIAAPIAITVVERKFRVRIIVEEKLETS
jgi:hypothetical protein